MPTPETTLAARLGSIRADISSRHHPGRFFSIAGVHWPAARLSAVNWG
ncbi:MAG: hypothetical protein LBI99_04665 [Propionibacteriaceae bacterium]|nr:hypothetical protein [Propionibacteriaceae bacterium]